MTEIMPVPRNSHITVLRPPSIVRGFFLNRRLRNDFPGRVPGASRKGPGKAIGEKVVPGDAEVGQREEDEVTQMGARVGEGKGGSV